MKNYRKDKKITILRCDELMDGYGYPTERFSPLEGAENIWAYYRHLSGNEFYAAHSINSKVEVVFGINWRPGIDTFMRVLYKNQEYRINHIDDFEDKKTDLKIYAYKIN